MSLFTDPQGIDAYGHRLAQLLIVGGYQLESRAACGKRVLFDTWAKAVRSEARKRGIEASPDQLRWLWDSLKVEPETKKALGKLMVDGAEVKPVKVLPKGCTFSIDLKNISTGYGRKGDAFGPKLKPTAKVTIDNDLYMKRGKKNHLECQPLKATLCMTIHSDVDSEEAEAAKMKAKPTNVSVAGSEVTVQVGSLNQAYTKASLRLEPDRQSHGGRTYDALFWIAPPGEQVSLGEIRDDVECGKWTFPDLSLSEEE
ncbi:MAG: hypothetical protein HQ567_29630 [Candidatus Nealsonbacteria bacterium]|nr:hypothetical protein [Candidatus Nealsonbacteria bacterium]